MFFIRMIYKLNVTQCDMSLLNESFDILGNLWCDF